MTGSHICLGANDCGVKILGESLATMTPEHFSAEYSCRGNGTTVGIDHIVLHCNQMILTAYMCMSNVS